jgi:hypothetical protein
MDQETVMPESIWTQEDIDALRSAIRRGVKRARKDGEEIEYNSLAEMQALLSSMQESVSAAAGTPGFVRLTPHKGYDR